MAYRYPPPLLDKSRNEHVAPLYTPVMNVNIPPPGFDPTYISETQQQDFYSTRPPPLSMLPPLPTQLQQSIWQHPEWNPAQTLTNSAPPTETPDVSYWLQNWLKKIKLNKSGVPEKKFLPIKINEARQMSQLVLHNLKELRSLQDSLTSGHHNMNPITWKEKLDQIKLLKDQINVTLEKLQNPTVLDALRKELTKRSKKREREKRRRADCKEMAAEARATRQHLHERIDTWLKDMQDVVERAKREESLKHEADQVLSEVTHRKAEARRQINMLKSLQKLRRVRAQTASNRGQHIDADSGIRFAKVVEHLLKLWEDQLKDYEKEERGLRVMLDEAVEERTKSEVSQMKQNLVQWEQLLFGKRGQYNAFYQAAEQDGEAFVAIRKSWDRFVASPGAVMASSIPVGWVLPANPSSEKWESLLMKDEKK